MFIGAIEFSDGYASGLALDVKKDWQRYISNLYLFLTASPLTYVSTDDATIADLASIWTINEAVASKGLGEFTLKYRWYDFPVGVHRYPLVQLCGHVSLENPPAGLYAELTASGFVVSGSPTRFISCVSGVVNNDLLRINTEN